MDGCGVLLVIALPGAWLASGHPRSPGIAC